MQAQHDHVRLQCRDLTGPVRPTSHGIAAGAGKLGRLIGTYALTAPGHRVQQDQRHRGRRPAGRLPVTVTLLLEPKGISLEELTETQADHVNMASAGQRVSGTGPERNAAGILGQAVNLRRGSRSAAGSWPANCPGIIPAGQPGSHRRAVTATSHHHPRPPSS